MILEIKKISLKIFNSKIKEINLRSLRKPKI